MLLTMCSLALFLFSLSITATGADSVLYHQSFSNLTDVANAGIRKGSDGADSFELLLDGDLVINNHTDRRSYTVLPYELPSRDHTIEFSFSFERADAASAYVGFMLTCRGDEPDNITSVVIRANGDCEGFGTLKEEIVEKMMAGELVRVKIPVKDGDYYELSVSAGGVVDTLSRKTAGGIPKGQIGFVVRRGAVRVHDISVVSGVGYGGYHGSSADDTWSDDNPYIKSQSEDKLYLAAPPTSDAIAPAAVALFVSGATFIGTMRKKERRKFSESRK